VVLPAWTAWIAYARDSDEAIAARIGPSSSWPARSKMPSDLFRFLVVPHAERPDGKGGKWTDEKYNSRVWNATKKADATFRTPNAGRTHRG